MGRRRLDRRGFVCLGEEIYMYMVDTICWYEKDVYVELVRIG